MGPNVTITVGERLFSRGVASFARARLLKGAAATDGFTKVFPPEIILIFGNHFITRHSESFIISGSDFRSYWSELVPKNTTS